MQPIAVGPRNKIVRKHRKQLLPEFAIDLKGLGKNPSTVITHLISAKKANEFMRKILQVEEENDYEDEIWIKVFSKKIDTLESFTVSFLFFFTRKVNTVIFIKRG